MSPQLETTRDREQLAAYLQRLPHLNFYHLGDLDDFFFPRTTWYVSRPAGEIDALALVYRGVTPPVLLAIENHNLPALSALMAALLPSLPRRIYSHLSPGLEPALHPRFRLDHHGQHLKMVLTRQDLLPPAGSQPIRRLSETDLPAIQRLYAAAYPGNWFDPRMLATGHYLGMDAPSAGLIAVAGVHVFSPAYRVAALGNIATHPEHRRRGLAAALTAALCRRLLAQVDTIGLNVRADNTPALGIYQRLGFEQVAVYHEYMLTRS